MNSNVDNERTDNTVIKIQTLTSPSVINKTTLNEVGVPGDSGSPNRFKWQDLMIVDREKDLPVVEDCLQYMGDECLVHVVEYEGDIVSEVMVCFFHPNPQSQIEELEDGGEIDTGKFMTTALMELSMIKVAPDWEEEIIDLVSGYPYVGIRP